MITDEERIRPLTPKASPVLIAIQCYRKWKKGWWLSGTLWFISDVIDHLLRGVVISQPECLVLAKVVEMGQGKDPVLFVRMASGDLTRIAFCIAAFSLPYHLSQIAFCRHWDSRVRVYPLIRIAQIARREKR